MAATSLRIGIITDGLIQWIPARMSAAQSEPERRNGFT